MCTGPHGRAVTQITVRRGGRSLQPPNDPHPASRIDPQTLINRHLGVMSCLHELNWGSGAKNGWVFTVRYHPWMRSVLFAMTLPVIACEELPQVAVFVGHSIANGAGFVKTCRYRYGPEPETPLFSSDEVSADAGRTQYYEIEVRAIQFCPESIPVSPET